MAAVDRLAGALVWLAGCGFEPSTIASTWDGAMPPDASPGADGAVDGRVTDATEFDAPSCWSLSMGRTPATC